MADIIDVINDLLAKLNTLKTSGVVQFVDIFNDHFEENEKGLIYSFPLPALFLEIVNDEDFQQLSDGIKQVDLDLRIHIGHEFYNNVSQGAEDGGGAIAQDLTIFDLQTEVLQLLFGYKPVGCGIIFQVKEDQDYKHKNVYHKAVRYTCPAIITTGSKYDPTAFARKYVLKTSPTSTTITVGQPSQFIETEDGCFLTDNQNDLYQSRLKT